MKRKIATMLLAFAIFVPALFALTACGDGDTAVEPKVTGVCVELADSDYQLIENSITISYGCKLKLDCIDFVVRAVLDNGGTKVVLPKTDNKAGYVFTSTIAEGDPTPAGEYCLTFAYAGFEREVSVNVLKADVDMSGVAWDYSNAFTYDKNEKEVKILNLPNGVEVEYQGCVKATAAGKYTATAIFTYVDTDNYNAISQKELQWEIKKADIDVAGKLSALNAEYDGQTHTIQLNTDLLPDNVVVGEITGQTEGIDAGEYNVSVALKYTGEDKANYNAIPNVNLTWEITPGIYAPTGEITLEENDYTYDGTAKTVAIDVSSIDSNVEVKSASGLEQINAGTHCVVVKLKYIGTSNNYDRVNDVTIEWVIKRAKLTVTANDHAITYGQAAGNNGFSVTGFAGNDNNSVLQGKVEYTYNYQAGDSVGNYDIGIVDGCIAAQNYDITFVSGKLVVNKAAVTVKANDSTINYNEIPTNNGITVTGLVAGDVEADLGSPAFTFVDYSQGANVGAYDIVVSGLSNDNYNINYEKGVLTVQAIDVPKQIIDQLRNIALLNNEIVYTGSKISVQVDETTLPEGISIESIIDLGEDPIVVGEYQVKVNLRWHDETNYKPLSPSSVTLTWNIIKATIEPLTEVGLVDDSFVYTGVEQEVEITGLSSLVKIGAISGNSAKNAGDYTAKLTLVNVDNHNYNDFTQVIDLDWEIEKAVLTITANNHTITYGDGANNNGYEIYGYVAKENASVITGEAAFTYSGYVAGSDVGEYSISLSSSTLKADNYTIEYVDAILTVEAKKVDVAWVAFAELGDTEYTGEAIKPELDVLPEGVQADYTYYTIGQLDMTESENPTEIGYYRVVARLSAINANYTIINYTEEVFANYYIAPITINMAGVDWDIEQAYDYVGKAITPELNNEVEGVTYHYVYKKLFNSAGGGFVVQDWVEADPIEPGVYRVFVTLQYDQEHCQLVNAEFEEMQEYTIDQVTLDVSSLNWSVEAKLNEDESSDEYKCYNAQLQYVVGGHRVEVNGATDILAKLNIVYDFNGESGLIDGPTITAAGQYYVNANISLKDEYAQGYILELSCLMLELTIENQPFKSITLDGQDFSWQQFTNKYSYEYGSVLNFEINEGYKVTDGVSDITSIAFDSNDKQYYISITTQDDQNVYSNYLMTYVMDEMYVDGEQIANPDYSYSHLELTAGQNSFEISFDERYLTKYDITYNINCINGDPIKGSITSVPFIVSDATNILDLSVDIDINDQPFTLVKVLVYQYSPVEYYEVEIININDGETYTSSGRSDLYNELVTGIYGYDSQHNQYANTKAYLDAAHTMPVDFQDINSYNNKPIYVVVCDDQDTQLAETIYSIRYNFQTIDQIMLSPAVEMYNVGNINTIDLTIDTVCDDISIVSTVDGTESAYIELEDSITQLNVGYQIMVGEDYLYYFDMEITIMMAVNSSDCLDTTSGPYVNIKNTSTNSEYSVNTMDNSMWINNYNAGNVMQFESELPNLQIAVAEGYTEDVDSRKLQVVDDKVYLVLTLTREVATYSARSSSETVYCYILLQFNGKYDNDTSGQIFMRHDMAGQQTLLTAGQTNVISDASMQYIDVQLENHFAKAVIINSNDQIIVTTDEHGRIERHFLTSAGQYTLKVTATNGTTAEYPILVEEFDPVLAVEIANFGKLEMLNPTDRNHFTMDENGEEIVAYLGKQDAPATLTINSIASSVLSSQMLYYDEEGQNPIDTTKSFDLTVSSIGGISYAAIYAVMQIDEQQTRVTSIIFCFAEAPSDEDEQPSEPLPTETDISLTIDGVTINFDKFEYYEGTYIVEFSTINIADIALEADEVYYVEASIATTVEDIAFETMDGLVEDLTSISIACDYMGGFGLAGALAMYVSGDEYFIAILFADSKDIPSGTEVPQPSVKLDVVVNGETLSTEDFLWNGTSNRFRAQLLNTYYPLSHQTVVDNCVVVGLDNEDLNVSFVDGGNTPLTFPNATVYCYGFDGNTNNPGYAEIRVLNSNGDQWFFIELVFAQAPSTSCAVIFSSGREEVVQISSEELSKTLTVTAEDLGIDSIEDPATIELCFSQLDQSGNKYDYAIINGMEAYQNIAATVNTPEYESTLEQNCILASESVLLEEVKFVEMEAEPGLFVNVAYIFIMLPDLLDMVGQEVDDGNGGVMTITEIHCTMPLILILA